MRSAHTRIAYAAFVAAIAVASGCYDVPQPDCGFVCGPPAVQGGAGTCPDNYVCSSIDNRCHRISPPYADPCPGDAGPPVDLRPPQLVGRSPAPDSTDVPTGVGFIEAVFDEQVDHIYEFPNFLIETPTLGMVPTSPGTIEQRADGWHYTLFVSGAFASSTEYTATLGEGITDLAGNHFLGAEWSFTTAPDTTAPVVSIEVPSMLANVSVFTSVQVAFSEPVIGVTGSTFTLTGPSGPIAANVSTGGSPSSFATLDPLPTLDPSTQYTIDLTSGITDPAGNALAPTQVTFTTAADPPPQVTSLAPTIGSTNVAVSANVVATFNEPVTNVNGTTMQLAGPSGIVAAQVTSTATSGTLDPIHQLLPNTTYTITLSSGIVDSANNSLTQLDAMFTTGADTVPPTVRVRQPALGATGIAVDAQVIADFDEDITNASAATILLSDGSTVPATVAYQGAPMFRATLTPSTQLAASTTYTVVLAPALQDTSQNLLATQPAWTFTTGADTVAPRVASTSPADNATDVPLDATISVTFDEPVTGVDATSFVVMNAGTGTLAASNGGRTWTFTPDAPLAAATTVTIMLTMGIQDAAGNALVPFTFDLTTVP